MKKDLVRVLVSDPIDPNGLDLIKHRPGFEIVHGSITNGTSLENVDAWLVRSETKVTKQALNLSKKLKLIGRAGTGVDNIDVEEATKRGILVINVAGANSIAVAEHAMALMLSLARKITLADSRVKSGLWRDKSLIGSELYGRTLGIFGFGRVGREVARRALAFHMKVKAHDPFLTPEETKASGVELVSLKELFRVSDVVSLHAALTDKTRCLIGKKILDEAKQGLWIINTSRGEIIDEEALADALRSGRVQGCALDVFRQEPPVSSPLLAFQDKVILTPHLGASTHEAQRRVAMELAQSVIAFFEQGIIRSGVNLPSGFDPDILERLGANIALAERMGNFLGQILSGAWRRLELTTVSRFNSKEQSVLLQAALRGVLSCALGDKVSMVNAGYFAKERALAHQASYYEDFPSGALEEIALDLQIVEGARVSIGGRVDVSGALKFTRIGNLMVDVTPTGTLIVLENRDKPGIIGKVGTLLGHKHINIADMRVGRTKKGADAIMVITVDGKVSQSALQALTGLQAIKRATLVVL